jgi:hypothetical protein
MAQELVNKARFNGNIVDGRIVRSILRESLVKTFKSYIYSTDDTEYLDDVLRGMEVIGVDCFLKQMADKTDYIDESAQDKMHITQDSSETDIIAIYNSRK